MGSQLLLLILKVGKMTQRQEIIDMLRYRSLTVKEIADEFLTIPEIIVEHLKHIKATVYPQEKLMHTDPACRDCGFIFKERQKLKPPGKCPKCKSHRIDAPKYFIKKKA